MTCLQFHTIHIHPHRHDFNDELGDGKTFDGWGGVEKRWGEYAKEVLMMEADPDSGADADADADADDDGLSVCSRSSRKTKADPLDLVTVGGKLMIGDLKDTSLKTMAAMLRGWVTAHYRQFLASHYVFY